MSSPKCPFPSASNVPVPNKLPSHCGRHGLRAATKEASRTVVLLRSLALSATLSISLRFTGSPYTPGIASRSETRFFFRRGTRTARVNLNLILTGMFLAERHCQVFLELSPHSNLWA